MLEFLYQIYEGGDTIVTGEGLEFEYETDNTESSYTGMSRGSI